MSEVSILKGVSLLSLMFYRSTQYHPTATRKGGSFESLKRHASDQLHENADSYALLAHTMFHGAPEDGLRSLPVRQPLPVQKPQSRVIRSWKAL